MGVTCGSWLASDGGDRDGGWCSVGAGLPAMKATGMEAGVLWELACQRWRQPGWRLVFCGSWLASDGGNRVVAGCCHREASSLLQGVATVLGFDPLRHVLGTLVLVMTQHGPGEVVAPVLFKLRAAGFDALHQRRAMAGFEVPRLQ